MERRSEGQNFSETEQKSPESLMGTQKEDESKLIEEIVALRPDVIRFIHKKGIVRDYPNVVEDIADNVIIKAVRSIKSFERKSKISTWVLTIATNTAKDFLEDAQKDLVYQAMLAKKATKRKSNNLYNEDLIVDPASQLEEEILKRGDRELVRAILQDMPELYREILLLKMQGFEPMELAQKLNISYSAVKQRNVRSMKMFREMYETRLSNDKIKVKRRPL